MDEMPPSYVEKVGDGAFPRYVIRDRSGRYWARDRWSDNPSEAVLFCREIEAIEAKNRYCLDGHERDTFVSTAVVCVRASQWTAEELSAWLKQHGRFFLPGPRGNKGMTIAILPSAVKKVNDVEDDDDDGLDNDETS